MVEVARDGRLPLIALVEAGVREQQGVGRLEDDDRPGLGVLRPVGLGVGALAQQLLDLEVVDAVAGRVAAHRRPLRKSERRAAAAGM